MIRVLLNLIFCLSLLADLMPEVTRTIVSPATVISVHDGDTITIAVPGNRSYVGPIRLRNVSAAELNNPGGKSARANLERLLPVGIKVRVQLTYTESGLGVETLCRPLANVWLENSGLHINEQQAFYLKANKWWRTNKNEKLQIDNPNGLANP